jgi:hypothetical protein
MPEWFGLCCARVVGELSKAQRGARIVGVLGLLGLVGLACVSEAEGEGEDGDGDGDHDDPSEAGDAGSSGEFVDLLDHAEWQPVDAADDPLADHRPSVVECGIAGWYPEGSAIEVNTNWCNYLALGQPSRAPIHAGAGVQLGFYYFNLTAPEPALAHLALLVDGQVLYEQEVEIPGDARVAMLEFEAPFDAPEGAPLVFHLHNHGQNTWVLMHLRAEQ